MLRASIRAVLAAAALCAAPLSMELGAQQVKPPAISPGGGPQRWNVVDGTQKQTVASYRAKEALAPEPPKPAKPNGVARANTKRTRTVVEDAVFAPLNQRKNTAKYRYYNR